jgi:carboxyl-terminal processing protease
MAVTTNRFNRSKGIALAATLAGLLICWSSVTATAENPQVALSTPVKVSNLSPLDVHPRTSLTIVEQLRHNHYLAKDKNLNDQLSSHIFEKYLDMLDGGRAYFTQSDISELEKYRYELDDALRRGNLEPAFDVFNRYQSRLVNRLEFLLAEIDQGLDKLDFAATDSIEIDRENAPWHPNEAALDEYWRKRLKAATLSMVLNGKELSEIQTLLNKRYKNRLKQAQQTKSEDAFQLYVNAFASTYDPHTQYFSPRTSRNFNINMSLSLEGIGAVLRNEDEYTSIVELVPAGPADKSGLIGPSDRIISVGQGNAGPLIDIVGWRLDDVVELIRGPKGSEVRLEIIPNGTDDGISKIVSITRNRVQLEEQAAQRKVLTLDRNGKAHKIGVIEIPTFYVDFKAVQQGDPNYKSTTRDVRRLIEELKTEGVEGLVIDLRNNGGGSLQEADTLTGLFIKSGPTVQVKSANRRPSIYADNDDQTAWDGPLAVMVNRLSASASEIFAGAIQDYERGIIIGSQTFGKGTVQTLIPLNRGQLKVTAAKFYRVSGQSTQHQGIIPDIQFPSVYDIERIGESSLDDAMQWDKIDAAAYPRSNQIQPVLGELKARHDQRSVADPDFRYFRAVASKSKENNRRTHLSLNEAQRRQEKADEDAWRLQLENTLRTAKGEAVLESLDALDEERETDEDPNKDAMLRETGAILLDYVGLSRQVAFAAPEASGIAIVH